MPTPLLQLFKQKYLESFWSVFFLSYHISIRKFQWIFLYFRIKLATSYHLNIYHLWLHTIVFLNYWKSLLIEFSASPFLFIQSILKTAARVTDLFRTEVKSCPASPQNSPMCSHPTQSNCHCPRIGPKHAWSTLVTSLLSFILLSQTYLAVSQSDCTWLCLRCIALTTAQPETYYVQPNTIFFP